MCMGAWVRAGPREYTLRVYITCTVHMQRMHVPCMCLVYIGQARSLSGRLRLAEAYDERGTDEDANAWLPIAPAGSPPAGSSPQRGGTKATRFRRPF